MNIANAPLMITSLACLICAISDLRRFRVPNGVTLPLLISGFVYQLGTAGWSGLWFGLTGAAFGFAILIVPYALGAMGAGDVKLLAAIGAWLGRPMTADVMMIAVIFGGLYAFALTVAAGGSSETLARVRTILVLGRWRAEVPVNQMVDREDSHGRLVPFAAMIAVGLVSIALYR